MDSLIYIANGLNLLSYTVRDLLHLRLLTLASVSSLAMYFASRPEPLMEVVCWNIVFLLLNVIQIVRILWRRYKQGATGVAVMGDGVVPA